MIIISESMYKKFQEDWKRGQYAGKRFGQAFFQAFGLDEFETRVDYDVLYNEEQESKAKKMIASLFTFK